MVREKPVVERIRTALERQGAVVFKTFGSEWRKGDPDLIVCFPQSNRAAVFVAIEVKQPGEEPRPIQAARLRQLSRAGGIAFWTDDSTGIVERIQKEIDQHVGTRSLPEPQ